MLGTDFRLPVGAVPPVSDLDEPIALDARKSLPRGGWRQAHVRTLETVKAYYEARAPEYDDWVHGNRQLRRSRPSRLA
jgi:hypothetical protein